MSGKWASVSISDGAMSARITLHLRGTVCTREDSCWLHTHTHMHNSPWDQLFTRHTSLFCYIQALSVSVSLPLLLPCLLPLARLRGFALLVLSAVFSLFLTLFCCLSFTNSLSFLSLSFNRTALRGSGGVSGAVCLCAVSVLWKPPVWWNFWCVPTVMCHHQLLPHSAHLWPICSLRQHKQKQLKLTLALPIITTSNEISLTDFSEKSHLNCMFIYIYKHSTVILIAFDKVGGHLTQTSHKNPSLTLCALVWERKNLVSVVVVN